MVVVPPVYPVIVPIATLIYPAPALPVDCPPFDTPEPAPPTDHDIEEGLPN